ncbi:NAD(P)H-dependent oxidoreductase [Flavobacterium sp. AC]|uniref:FMN dependent NADH:quinone oxidoreductase n=1 Tax=Flavobacterium azizsancarii TaxID=2961580 RepID=A0ABT4WJ50_9FLAO|nr:NAD(P)H-dependent oxidoreductase [Flavobacterium azizsancarii]MDA6072491.1 NAD(P)H-dependent oxidoreductase [Flavobacterium azizsancarii]
MKKVLVLNSSARKLNSKSRKLTEVFTDHWKNIHNNPVIHYRDLADSQVPHIDEAWIAAAFKPKASRSPEEIEALTTSNTYIAELQEADVIVIGAPMYNWSIPSTFKAYIDQILRVNETWKLNPDNFENPYFGLLKNKTLFLLLSRGAQGYEKGEYNEHMNFQSNYLKTVFNIIGVTNIHVVAVNGESFDPEKYQESIKSSHQAIKDLIEKELN